MNHDNREKGSDDQKTPRKNAFINVYKHNEYIKENPEKYHPKMPEKDPSTLFVVFVLSLGIPVFGIVLYAIWREDELWLARASLIGFFLNVLLTVFTIVSMFVF